MSKNISQLDEQRAEHHRRWALLRECIELDDVSVEDMAQCAGLSPKRMYAYVPKRFKEAEAFVSEKLFRDIKEGLGEVFYKFRLINADLPHGYFVASVVKPQANGLADEAEDSAILAGEAQIIKRNPDPDEIDRLADRHDEMAARYRSEAAAERAQRSTPHPVPTATLSSGDGRP